MDNCDTYPDSSDSSDEDYVPDSKIEDAVSEVDSDGDPEDQMSGSDSETKNKKRTKKPVKKAKIVRKERESSPERSTSESIITQEDQKKKADDLWADFMKDTGFKSKGDNKTNISDTSSKLNSSVKTDGPKKKQDPVQKPPDKVKVTQIFEFAGEEVKVEKEVNANSAEARLLAKDSTQGSATKRRTGLSGIGSVLNQLGKKQKISTLEKTKLDWDRFKKEENIDEELQTHNKGKDGYLERQDFLERADLRRFEIEREIRNVERAKRFNPSTL